MKALVAVALFVLATGAAQASSRGRDGRILFVTSFDAGFGRHANVVGVDPATGELTTVAAANVDTEDPAASRDGRRLAFARGSQEGGPLRGLYVSDGQGRHVRRIAPFGLSPTWSPGGSRLAYIRNGHVVVMRADGTHRDVLPMTNVGQVAWSPRGNRLLVVRGVRACCLQLVRPDGTGLKTVLRVRTPEEKVVHPAWSPDGRRIAYEHDHACVGLTCSGGQTEIATVNGRVVQTVDGFYLTWSPTGTRVAYATGDGVFVRSLAGGSPMQIFKGTLETFGISWQAR